MSIGLRWVRSFPCSYLVILIFPCFFPLFFPVLHPRHKLSFFKNAGWSEKRCKAAYVVVRDTFEMCYKNRQCAEEPVSPDNVRHLIFPKLLCPHRHTAYLLSSNNQSHLRRTCLITFLRWLRPGHQISVMNWSATSTAILSTSQMSSYGGLRGNTLTQPLPVWQWIISLSQVRYMFISPTDIHTDTFLATSVNVERVFSKGRILLSHLRSRLSVQSTRALMCLGEWSSMGFVKDSDIIAAAALPEVDGEEEELGQDWDAINVDT